MLHQSQLFAEAEELDPASNTTIQNTAHDDNKESNLFHTSGLVTIDKQISAQFMEPTMVLTLKDSCRCGSSTDALILLETTYMSSNTVKK